MVNHLKNPCYYLQKKSDTASFEIPELDFYMNAGTLGGKFTTIEGILKDCRENLSQGKTN